MLKNKPQYHGRTMNFSTDPNVYIYIYIYIIYKFQCCCDATYIGRISQCLDIRVRQHVPRGIRDRTTYGHSQM